MKTTYLLLLSTTLTFAVGGAPSVAAAGGEASTPSLSLSQVTGAVLANNPGIREALKKWKAANARIPQAAAWDDPKVIGESRVQRYVSVPPNAFTDQMVSVEQVVPITGKNLARARIAAAEGIFAYQNVRRQQLDTIAAARASFFRLANAYAQIDINRKNIESLKQIADISRAKYEAGTQSAADVLVAETEATKLVEAQRDLERQLSDEQSRLNQLMNRDAFAPLGQPEMPNIEPPELSPSQLRPLTLTHRPEIKMAEAKIEAQKSKLQLARREWIPDPALGVRGERYNDAAQTVSELDMGVSFAVPWVNFRKYAAETREANEEVGAAQQGLNREQTEALRLLRNQLEKIETFHHHLELFRDKLVPQARQAFEANRLAYESGKVSFLDWITSQRLWREIEATARMHLSDYQVAVAELEAIVGAQVYPLPGQQAESANGRIGESATTKGRSK
jgi:cobalt-zinc-cadmium efflux system outer membrane protein